MADAQALLLGVANDDQLGWWCDENLFNLKESLENVNYVWKPVLNQIRKIQFKISLWIVLNRRTMNSVVWSPQTFEILWSTRKSFRMSIHLSNFDRVTPQVPNSVATMWWRQGTMPGGQDHPKMAEFPPISGLCKWECATILWLVYFMENPIKIIIIDGKLSSSYNNGDTPLC